jgi:hypothetical protein
VAYDADAVVGGMVGGVGQRMLTSVSKRMAGEFFKGIGEAIGGAPRGLDTPPPSGSGGRAASASGAGGRAASASERVETPAAVGAVFTPPAKQADEFLRGIAVGAGLVLLGVAAGRLLGRR